MACKCKTNKYAGNRCEFECNPNCEQFSECRYDGVSSFPIRK